MSFPPFRRMAITTANRLVATGFFHGLLAGVCGLSGVAQAATVQVAVQTPSGKPVAGAVAFLESPEAALAAKPMQGADMAQEKKAFAPDVLVVTRGTSVNFPNRDTVRHHVYSFSPTKKFELKLYTGTPANPVLFDRAGVAVLGCNIHDSMVGWVLVVDTPYFANTAASGSTSLTNVPPGNYTLRVWHANLPTGAEATSQPVKVAADGAVAVVRLSNLQP